MFTGIVEDIGVIKQVVKSSKSTKLTILATKIMSDLKYGDSVATDGVCLTVSELSPMTFSADVMAQTLRFSTLGKLRVGDRVNLERALQLSNRFGGHIVSGHIDCVGRIVNIYQEDIARWIEIEIPRESMKYIVAKGSVSVDGISLTVAKLDKTTFWISTIPVTQSDTTLAQKKVGEDVNIELDILAKYTERLLNFGENKEKKSQIDRDFLKENGFI